MSGTGTSTTSSAPGTPRTEIELRDRARARMEATRAATEQAAVAELQTLAANLAAVTSKAAAEWNERLSGELHTTATAISADLAGMRQQVNQYTRNQIDAQTAQAQREAQTRINQAEQQLARIKRRARAWTITALVVCLTLLAVGAGIGWIKATQAPATETITKKGKTYQVITEKGPWTTCSGKPCKQIKTSSD